MLLEDVLMLALRAACRLRRKWQQPEKLRRLRPGLMLLAQLQGG